MNFIRNGKFDTVVQLSQPKYIFRAHGITIGNTFIGIVRRRHREQA